MRTSNKIFLICWFAIAGLVLIFVPNPFNTRGSFNLGAAVAMLIVPVLVGLYILYDRYIKNKVRVGGYGRRNSIRRGSGYSSNDNSRYQETIRNLKNNQKELTRNQNEEMKRITSNLAKLESKMTSMIPKPIKTEQEQRTRTHFLKSANETDLQDNFSRFTPREMEELTGKLFEKKGYSVEVTKQSGDFGIDVWATNKDMKIGIQVKKWKANVGFDDVAKTFGSNLSKANKYIVISTDSFFTNQAMELQRQNSHMIELWDTDRFKQELRDNGLIT